MSPPGRFNPVFWVVAAFVLEVVVFAVVAKKAWG